MEARSLLLEDPSTLAWAVWPANKFAAEFVRETIGSLEEFSSIRRVEVFAHDEDPWEAALALGDCQKVCVLPAGYVARAWPDEIFDLHAPAVCFYDEALSPFSEEPTRRSLFPAELDRAGDVPHGYRVDGRSVLKLWAPGAKASWPRIFEPSPANLGEYRKALAFVEKTMAEEAPDGRKYNPHRMAGALAFEGRLWSHIALKFACLPNNPSPLTIFALTRPLAAEAKVYSLLPDMLKDLSRVVALPSEYRWEYAHGYYYLSAVLLPLIAGNATAVQCEEKLYELPELWRAHCPLKVYRNKCLWQEACSSHDRGAIAELLAAFEALLAPHPVSGSAGVLGSVLLAEAPAAGGACSPADYSALGPLAIVKEAVRRRIWGQGPLLLEKFEHPAENWSAYVQLTGTIGGLRAQVGAPRARYAQVVPEELFDASLPPLSQPPLGPPLGQPPLGPPPLGQPPNYRFTTENDRFIERR